ncbi:MAG TPA: DNA repair protein RadC [Solirubrobacteraceae bacterium]|jgi:DNA repair protein RadC|nr:DNA repair protein RadC [Solirubrobacteraceae bacterium]
MTTVLADLPPQERPRERLLQHGPEALSESELLAIILRSGRRGKSALDLATSLLGEYGALSALASARPEELATRQGVGAAKAATLVAAFQLGRRVGPDDTPHILRSPSDVTEVARRQLDGLRRERVLVLVCDAANRLRRTVIVSEGSIDRSLVPVREILNAVLRHDGRAFAIAHNHPSGNAEPSEADHRATAEVREAARVVGLRFLGHVVVANGAPAISPIERS